MVRAAESVEVNFLHTGHMLVSCPYDREFLEALGMNGIAGKWNTRHKYWLFKPHDAASVYKLLKDFFNYGGET